MPLTRAHNFTKIKSKNSESQPNIDAITFGKSSSGLLKEHSFVIHLSSKYMHIYIYIKDVNKHARHLWRVDSSHRNDEKSLYTHTSDKL